MKTFLYVLLFIIYTAIVISGTWRITTDYAIRRRADDLEEYRRKRNQETLKHNEKVKELERSLNSTKSGLIVKITAYENLKATYDRLLKRYRIVVLTSKGLHKTVETQRKAYTELTKEYQFRESEHQKELEEIHKYYKETH